MSIETGRMLIFNMILIEVSTSLKHQTEFMAGNTPEETFLEKNNILHAFTYDDEQYKWFVIKQKREHDWNSIYLKGNLIFTLKLFWFIERDTRAVRSLIRFQLIDVHQRIPFIHTPSPASNGCQPMTLIKNVFNFPHSLCFHSEIGKIS